MKRDKRSMIMFCVMLVGLVGVVIALNVNDTDFQKQQAAGGILSVFDQSAVSAAMTPYQIDEASGTNTYLRYSVAAGQVFIKRISVSGTITTIEYTTDYWTNRVAASYSAINIR